MLDEKNKYPASRIQYPEPSIQHLDHRSQRFRLLFVVFEGVAGESISEPRGGTSEHQTSTSELQASTSELQASTLKLQKSTSEHQTSTSEHQTSTSEHQARLKVSHTSTSEHLANSSSVSAGSLEEDPAWNAPRQGTWGVPHGVSHTGCPTPGLVPKTPLRQNDVKLIDITSSRKKMVYNS